MGSKKTDLSSGTKRPSLARAFLFWCYDMEGVLTWWGEFRKYMPDQSLQECRRYARARYKSAVSKHGGLRRAIDATCWNCVGSGADVGGINLIRQCNCSRCPLHPVRPLKEIKGRRKLGNQSAATE